MYDFTAFILSFFWCGSAVGQTGFLRNNLTDNHKAFSHSTAGKR